MAAVTVAEGLRVRQWIEIFRATEIGAPFGVSPPSTETTTTATETTTTATTSPTFGQTANFKLGNTMTPDQLDKAVLLEAKEFEGVFGLNPDDLRPGQKAAQVAFEGLISGEVRKRLDGLAVRARSIVILEIIRAALEAESP